MRQRRIDEESSGESVVLVLNLKNDVWERVPRHLGVYVLGFPCTPWSMRGLGKGWNDPHAAPFFVGIESIKRIQPLILAMECAPFLKHLERQGQVNCAKIKIRTERKVNIKYTDSSG